MMSRDAKFSLAAAAKDPQLLAVGYNVLPLPALPYFRTSNSSISTDLNHTYIHTRLIHKKQPDDR
jgi:hypothetical protein